MNIGDILRQGWRITWRCWPLWLLNLLLFILFIPAGALAGAFGAVSAMLSLPWPGRPPALLIQLRQIPGWAWVGIAAAGVVLLVVTSAGTWMLQAASMRGAAIAAERGAFALGEALRLGRQRVFSILKLSITFGLLISALAVLPPLGLLLLADRFAFGLPLLQMAQTVLAPLNSVLGLALLLVMMSVALEDLTPRAAFGQAWRVFRFGWWGFLLIIGLSLVPGIILALLMFPIALVLPVVFFYPKLGSVLLLACCGVLGPIGLGVMLFTAVFTVVLYTLMYRSAARLTGPPAPDTRQPV